MNVAIIVAAGQGLRFGGARPKQFQELAGTPVIFHTLSKFEQCAVIDCTIVVLRPNDLEVFNSLASKRQINKVANLVKGGASRAESVWLGLQVVDSSKARIVAVHDGVRPLVTVDEISRTVSEAEKSGAAILAAPVRDTIKQVDGSRVKATLDRSTLLHALTPQCFRYELLYRAYDEQRDLWDQATDDSFLVEQIGATVQIVEGSERNIKITNPEDLEIAERMMFAG